MIELPIMFLLQGLVLLSGLEPHLIAAVKVQIGAKNHQEWYGRCTDFNLQSKLQLWEVALGWTVGQNKQMDHLVHLMVLRSIDACSHSLVLLMAMTYCIMKVLILL